MTNPIAFSKQAAAVPRSQPKVKLDQHDPLTKSAEQLVAQTFYGTMLRQARQSPFHSNMMDGGRGGQAFGEMLDQKLSEHMTRGAGAKLVHSLIRKFNKQPEYAGLLNKNKKSISTATLGHSLRTVG